MALLDDPQAQADLVTAMTSGMTRAQAAASVGISRQALTTYCKRNPDLQQQLEVAARRAKIVAHNAPRMIPAKGSVAGALGLEAGDLDARDPDAFLALVSRHANDRESRGCSKSLEILNQWHNAEHYLALQAKAKRDAALLEAADGKDTRPVIIRHGAAPPRVVDAELIERPPRLDS